MAFISVPPAWIEVGKAIKKKLITRIKDNLDDHEDRINSLELGSNKVEIFNFEVMGFINNYNISELVQIGTFKAPSDTTITEAKLTLMNGTSGETSSSNGVLSIDLEKSSDGGVTWSTILSTKPEIENGINTTGSESSLFTFISNGEDILEGEIIRVNVISKKDTQGSFLITVYGDVA